MDILEHFISEVLNEIVEKRGRKWFVVSHKTPGKLIGRNQGYPSKKKAITALLGMKSKGGFYNLPRKEKNKRIRSYRKKHNI